MSSRSRMIIRSHRAPALLAALTTVVLGVAACSTPAATAPPVTLTPASSPTLGPRPSSEATVQIAEPANGATIVGDSVHVVLKLNGAKIVTATTTNIRPDEGHVHLYLNGQIVSMNYGLEQDLPVTPGTYVFRAEFVAADHAPFNPRVESAEVVFTVK
ncbi:MAG TPA: hypothetical protein VHL56_00580 [Candidatus Limnocylindrales bacterium]|nr:hypothetical protein [Candidatus Limnocylindrales bacterium]